MRARTRVSTAIVLMSKDFRPSRMVAPPASTARTVKRSDKQSTAYCKTPDVGREQDRYAAVVRNANIKIEQ